MAITTIQNLKDVLNTGARSNLFRVTLTGLATTEKDTDFSYLCKAAQLPGSTLGIIEVPFSAGRRFKAAGDRTFADWTTTVINDSNHTIREALEDLQREYGVTDYNSETSKTRTGGAATEFSTILVQQLNQAGTVVYSYTLVNCWPQDISTIDLSYDSTDTLEEFTVTWSYDYFTFESPTVQQAGPPAPGTLGATG